MYKATLDSWPGKHCTKALAAVPQGAAASAQKGAFYPPRRSVFSNFPKVLIFL